MTEHDNTFLDQLVGKVEYSLTDFPDAKTVIEKSGSSMEEIARLAIMEMVMPLPEGPNTKTFCIDLPSFKVSVLDEVGIKKMYSVRMKGDWR